MRIVLVVLLLLATTCAPIQLGDGERKILAQELVAEVIVPTLDDVVARTHDLAIAIRAVPGELDAARTAWRAARTPWKEADAFGFGPATDLRLAAAIDQVIEPARIEDEIALATPIDIENLGANKKGFHAIEYLLFAPDAATALAAPRRLEFLVALADNLERKATELRAAWDAYGATFTEPGSANEAFPTIKTVIDAVVNESVFQAELVADARLGKPMGTATGGTPQPDLEESGPSDNSLADMTAALRSIRNALNGTRDGTPGKGIGKLVANNSPATAARARTAVADAIAAIDAIPRPYRDALLAAAPEIAAAHAKVKELKRLLATEVVANLGTTLGFNDNDGD